MEIREKSSSFPFTIFQIKYQKQIANVPNLQLASFFLKTNLIFLKYKTLYSDSKEEKSQILEFPILRKYPLPLKVGNPDPHLENYLERSYGENVQRLRCVKKKYGPESIFKFEQSIPSAPTDWDCRPHRL